MNKAINTALNSKIFLYALVILIAGLITAQNILLGEKHFWGGIYTHYNNYIIFKNSFIHLLENKNLYDFHYDKHGDLFKYSPMFALFMGLFFYLPDWLGLGIWNLLNGVVLLYAITTLPFFTNKKSLYLLLFVILELVLSIQYSQSNPLITGLTLLAFSSMEKGKVSQAAFFICCGIFIKLFAAAACIIFLFYPKKIRFLLWMGTWSILFFLLPALVTGISNLLHQYENWLELIKKDHSDMVGYSFFIILETIAGIKVNTIAVLGFGVLLLLAPILLIKKYKDYNFRLGYICLILIWTVIFNHKAESPSYIIAMTGIGIWGISKENTKGVIAILLITLFFTSLFSTDLIPPVLKENVNKPFVKTLMPCIAFFIILGELFIRGGKSQKNILPKE